ncbi:MAG TPA: hypothetical protein DD640_00390 [Clostridiales bacterium]|nr:hypothetical protein [Clostridiales bacterium]
MDKKVTIYDIAAKLNISTATVNRAINGKPRVSAETRRLVLDTAREMGFKANKAAVSLARKTIKIGFLMAESELDYGHEVLRGARYACERLADFNVQGDFQVVRQSDCPQGMIRIMQDMGQAGYGGIIMLPQYEMPGCERVIAELSQKQVPVVTAVSDLPHSKRLFSVRNNTRVSGKMAAEFLAMLAPGKPAAMFTAYKNTNSLVHQESIDGFLQEARLKTLPIVDIYENQDNPQTAYRATEKLLREHPDLGGLYIGTANSGTVCRKISELGYGGKIKVVASDIFPELNEYLRQGVIHATIFQEPSNIGALAFRYLYEYLAEGRKPESVYTLNPQLVLSSNLELFVR